MLIQDPEKFREWLTSKLDPLCDADPAALAKYVYALVKKDKPITELKSDMIDQLQVFLRNETQTFVDTLFKALETQNFELKPKLIIVPSPPKPAIRELDLRPPTLTVAPSIPIATAKAESVENSDHLEKKDDFNKELPDESNIIVSNSYSTTNIRKDNERIPRKSESDKEERGRRIIRRRGSSASPDRRLDKRSRSRSHERRRSRSRDRNRERAWRNKSPPPRRYERRRSYTKSPPVVRRRTRSRTPAQRRGGRYRNRSPPGRLSRSRSPLDRDRRDHSPLILKDKQNTNLQSVINVPAAEAAQNFTTRRCCDFEEKGFCIRGDLCPFDHGNDPVILEDLAVGSLMYNGTNRPQAQANTNIAPPTLPLPAINVHVPPPAINQVGLNNLAEYNPDSPSIEPRIWGRTPYRGGPVRGGLNRGALNRGGVQMHPQRELINVIGGQYPFHNSTRNFEGPPNAARDGMKRSFDYNRLGRGAIRANMPSIMANGNTTLLLKKVPVNVNNIAHLNSHFEKFGKIVNIQVNFEDDPESALITFSSPSEANIAHKSTEAVLNNRFIKVFWYTPSNKENQNKTEANNVTTAPPRSSAIDRLGTNKVLNNVQPSSMITNEEKEKVTMSNNNLSKTIYIAPPLKKESITVDSKSKELELKKKEEDEIKRKEEEDAIKELKRRQEEAKKERIKLNADLRKRKQDLLDKQLNQQKLLIKHLESGTVKAEQKTAMMATIKTLQDSIEELRKDLASDVKANITKITSKTLPKKEMVRRTKEEAQRELLDAEMDLFNRLQEGKDSYQSNINTLEIMELKKKVAELRLKAATLGITSTPKPATPTPYTRGRGAAAFRGIRGRGGRGRYSYSVNETYTPTVAANDPYNVVDHRPTKLLISGYEQDDQAEVLTHFAAFGEIIEHIIDKITPSLVVRFKNRKEAEIAIQKGRQFQDRLLSVTWATPDLCYRRNLSTQNHTINRSISTDTHDDVKSSEQVELDNDADLNYDDIDHILSTEQILVEDEEEDEDEERSWRR